jgi:hypothetical protein
MMKSVMSQHITKKPINVGGIKKNNFTTAKCQKIKVQTYMIIHVAFFFFYWDCGLTTGFHACKAGGLPLSCTSYLFCSGHFGDGVSELFALAGFNPPTFPILSS